MTDAGASETAPETAPEATDRRAGALRQALVTAGAGWVVFIVGSLLYAALDGFVLVADASTTAAAARLAVSPALLAWVIGVIIVGVVRVRRAGGLAAASVVRWSLGLTPVATLIGIAITHPATYAQPLVLLTPFALLIVGWQWAGLFGAPSSGRRRGGRHGGGGRGPAKRGHPESRRPDRCRARHPSSRSSFW